MIAFLRTIDRLYYKDINEISNLLYAWWQYKTTVFTL